MNSNYKNKPCKMRKKITDAYPTKAIKREMKKRPRMQVHSRSLLAGSKHAGKKIASKK
jgi:hypothetical protein